MDSLVLNKCFRSAAFHTWMVKWLCVGVPFGLGTGFDFCFGVLISMMLEVREHLAFLVGVVRTSVPSSAQRVGARLSVCGDFHLVLILLALVVFVMVVLGLFAT